VLSGRCFNLRCGTGDHVSEPAKERGAERRVDIDEAWAERPYRWGEVRQKSREDKLVGDSGESTSERGRTDLVEEGWDDSPGSLDSELEAVKEGIETV
jgi:hypothetical protein